MINCALEIQAKSIDELVRKLIGEWDGKKLIDSNVNPSSSCAFNFAQTNPQPSGTSVGGTSQPNRSAQPMTHFYSQTTIDSSAPIDGMSQETRANMFRQGYKHIAPNFSMSNPGPTPYTRGCNNQTYTNNNSNYQAPYYIVAYTYLIPLPSSSAGFLPNSTYHNTMWYSTQG
jgi:hypothetical protein